MKIQNLLSKDYKIKLSQIIKQNNFINKIPLHIPSKNCHNPGIGIFWFNGRSTTAAAV